MCVSGCGCDSRGARPRSLCRASACLGVGDSSKGEQEKEGSASSGRHASLIECVR